MKSEKPNIAIVEDEKDLCLVLVKFFQMRGIPVSFVAHDGFEAELNFQGANPKPNIIIMDNRLLTTKGTSITRNILKIAPSTKFIFLSADTNAEEEAYASGASIFLTKPTSLKIVEEAVNIVLNNSNQYSNQNNRFRVKEL